MKLYQSSSSPNSRRVRIFLAEKNIPVTIVPVDLGAKEQFSDAYRAINPRSVVPTLVLDDGTAIGEVTAIWRYLEEAHPGQPLLGTTAKDKAQVTMWERRAEQEGFAVVMEAVRNTVAGLKGRALAGRSKLRAQNFYADFNEHLKTVPFVAGEQFSAADITALVTVDFATGGLSTPIPAQLTALQAWYDKVAARASAKA